MTFLRYCRSFMTCRPLQGACKTPCSTGNGIGPTANHSSDWHASAATTEKVVPAPSLTKLPHTLIPPSCSSYVHCAVRTCPLYSGVSRGNADWSVPDPNIAAEPNDPRKFRFETRQPFEAVCETALSLLKSDGYEVCRHRCNLPRPRKMVLPFSKLSGLSRTGYLIQ